MRINVLLLLLFVVFATSADAARNVARALHLPRISAAEIEEVRAHPLSVLSKFLDGGPPMAQYVSRLVQADPSFASSLLSITDKATVFQASAIGAGLARAARAMARQQPQNAHNLAKQVENSRNQRLKLTFKAIGPSFSEDSFVQKPDMIAYPPLENRDIGDRLSHERSRLGPSEHNFQAIRGGAIAQESLLVEGQEITIEVRKDRAKDAIMARAAQGNIALPVQEVIVIPPPPSPPPPRPPVPPKIPEITTVIKGDAGSGGTVSTSPTM